MCAGTRPRGITEPARIRVWRDHHHYRGAFTASIVVWPQSGPRRSQGRVAPSLTYPQKSAARENPPPARFENPPFRCGMRARAGRHGGSRNPANSPRQRGPARAGKEIGAVTVQDSQQQARRVIGAEIVAAGVQTRCKPRQSRTMARHGAFALLAGEPMRPHKSRTGNRPAQLPHNRTIPHKFFCRLVPKVAK